MRPFGIDGFALRFLFAIVLVFATYNPEGVSYVHWALVPLPEFSVLKGFVGVTLLIGWVIFLRATLRSLGPFGLLLAGAFFGLALWLLVDMGWVSTANVRLLTYLVEIVFAAVLSTGLSWSHIRRRLSGQYDIDDVDDTPG